MIRRTYLEIIKHHIKHYDQMIFICGARQVGKTTMAKMLIPHERNYLNWDNVNHRTIIMGNIFEYINDEILPNSLQNGKTLLILDEIHKYSDWKNYLKGLYDQYKGRIIFIITGSARLDIYYKGGDSLMGRYFLYHIYQLSIGELIGHNYKSGIQYWEPDWAICASDESIINKTDDIWNRLFALGGYPEPYIKNDTTFYNIWQSLRNKQLFTEEIRDYARIYDIDQFELMGSLIAGQAACQLNYSAIAKKIQKPESTVRSWAHILQNTYYFFSIPPWSNSITRSILKMPKIYLYDWSVITDYGNKVENFIAVHLLKSISYWNNIGLGTFNLFYLRDKEQHEADFLIVWNNQPWMILEVKAHDTKMSSNLAYFQKQLNAKHVVQLIFDANFIGINVFDLKDPKIIPAKTLLSQLI